MGLQPIDLQTMYSQMSNLARQVANGDQGVQLAKSMQQVDIVKYNTEQSKKVQQTDENSKSANVNQNGHNGSQLNNKSGSKKDKDSEEPENKDLNRIKESYLGNHIDITR